MGIHPNENPSKGSLFQQMNVHTHCRARDWLTLSVISASFAFDDFSQMHEGVEIITGRYDWTWWWVLMENPWLCVPKDCEHHFSCSFHRLQIFWNWSITELLHHTLLFVGMYRYAPMFCRPLRSYRVEVHHLIHIIWEIQAQQPYNLHCVYLTICAVPTKRKPSTSCSISSAMVWIVSYEIRLHIFSFIGYSIWRNLRYLSSSGNAIDTGNSVFCQRVF